MEKKEMSVYSTPEVEIITLDLNNPVLVDGVSGGGHTNPGIDPDPLD